MANPTTVALMQPATSIASPYGPGGVTGQAVYIVDQYGNLITSLNGVPVSITSQVGGLPSALPAIVQKANAASTGSVATLPKAFTNQNTAGNSIVVVCGVGNNTAMTVADSLGNTYFSAVNVANGATFEAAVFYATNILPGANTVTVTNAGAAASMGMQIYEVSGLIAQSANILDQTGSLTGTSAAPLAGNLPIAVPNEYAFMGIAVGTAAQAVSATAGSFWTLDSTQNPTTPSNLFTFGALSQPLGAVSYVVPKATIASSEPFALAVATFKPVVLATQGTFNLAAPYPIGSVPITAASGNVAAATAAATLTAVAGKTTYITGFEVSGAGATAGLPVSVTVTGTITGTLTYTYTAIAGVLLANTPLVVSFPYPIPASAPNTNIVVSCPTLGAGNTNNATVAHGFNL